MRSQLLAARAGFAALVLAVLIAGGAVAAVRLGQLAYSTALTAMIPATALGLIALACASFWFAQAARHNSGLGKRAGLIALIGALLFLYPPLITVYRGFTEPAIHDASSDPDDPPAFVALAKLRRPGMNGLVFDGSRKIRYRGEDDTIAYVLHEYYPEVTKPRGKLMPNNANPVKTLFWRSFEIAKSLGWTILDYSEKDGRIEATARSPWFGQVSDIVIRVRASGFMGARADARAESREGATDNGFNLSLLRAFKGRLGG